MLLYLYNCSMTSEVVVSRVNVSEYVKGKMSSMMLESGVWGYESDSAMVLILLYILVMLGMA